ncbi:hypothetical protein JEQ12_007811 [Ovis aries]|uniref:Uncharacterized protein n=1 Tax=Ovis aries TaxID=9940 RepID=A0A835ZWD6_SHEEP|nr:hypothetical protein JEQ12_007811 [Ovis aries]
MKYQKYLTVLQMAIGVTPSNRGSLLPLKRRLWVTPSSENPSGATSSVSQGKPSLRRIKGRLHRSKSLDSIDFCELTLPFQPWKEHFVRTRALALSEQTNSPDGGDPQEHDQLSEGPLLAESPPRFPVPCPVWGFGIELCGQAGSCPPLPTPTSHSVHFVQRLQPHDAHTGQRMSRCKLLEGTAVTVVPVTSGFSVKFVEREKPGCPCEAVKRRCSSFDEFVDADNLINKPVDMKWVDIFGEVEMNYYKSENLLVFVERKA